MGALPQKCALTVCHSVVCVWGEISSENDLGIGGGGLFFSVAIMTALALLLP